MLYIIQKQNLHQAEAIPKQAPKKQQEEKDEN